MTKRHPSSQAFHDLCDEMKVLHDRKQEDYGRSHDPFANVRSTEEWGQPAWVGAMIRATDKMRRLQKVAGGGTLSNEGVEDSFMDLAVYSIIGLVLYKELQKMGDRREPPADAEDKPLPGMSAFGVHPELHAPTAEEKADVFRPEEEKPAHRFPVHPWLYRSQ